MLENMCTSKWILKRFSCHAGYQEFSRCHTRYESEESIAHRQGSTLARNFILVSKPKQTSPQGYEWPHKIDSCPPFFEEEKAQGWKTKSTITKYF